MTTVLLDTDIGADSDDAVALGYLLGKEREGECVLPLVSLSTARPGAAGTVRAIAAEYGKQPALCRMEIPLPSDAFDHYATKVCTTFSAGDGAGEVLESWRALYEEAEKVVPVIVGPLTNLAAFLRAEPELFAAKTERVHLMAGTFTEPFAEFNAAADAAATDYVFAHLPCEGVILPYETGNRVFTGRTYLTRRERPIGMCLALAARAFGKTEDILRESWDPLTALTVFRPDLFTFSPRGNIVTDGKGGMRFSPAKDGKFTVAEGVDEGGAEREIERVLGLLFSPAV